MNKRLNIMLPDATLKVLDRLAPKGDRSRFISQAVLRLKQGALAHAQLDLEIAEEWFPVEQESWQRLEQEEQARKRSRSAGKSTSRRSTRR